MKLTIKKFVGLAILAPALLMLSLGYEENNAFSNIPLKSEVLSMPKTTVNGSVVNASITNLTGKSGITVAATPNVTALPIGKPNATTPAKAPDPTKTPVTKSKATRTITTPDSTPRSKATPEPDKMTPTPIREDTTDMTSSKIPNETVNPEENITTIQISNMTITEPTLSNSSLPNETANPDLNITTTVQISNMTITEPTLSNSSLLKETENPDVNITTTVQILNKTITEPILSNSSNPDETINPDDNITTQMPVSNMTARKPNTAMTTNTETSQKANTTTSLPAQELNFALVSDMHSSDKAQNTRFINTIFETNKIPGIDALVITGDLVNEPTEKNYETANIIFEKLNVPHFLVMGNHDGSESFFKENTGQEPERIEIINGYQIIFVGMKNDQWSFDFSMANKDLPTIIFVHGPAWGLNGRTCEQTWEELGYACNMGNKLDEFSNLLAVVSGHVHMYSKQETNGILYLTLDNLDGDSSPANNFIIMKIKNGNASIKQIAI